LRKTRELLSSRPPRSPLATPFTIVALLLLAGGSFALGRYSAGGGQAEIAAASDAIDEHEGEGGAGLPLDSLAADDEGPGGAGPAGGAPVEAAAGGAPSGPAAPAQGGLLSVQAEIRGSLGATLIQAVGAEVGDPLSLVTSRLLVWALDVSRDMRPLDKIELVYELPPGSEPVVHALRFDSHKLGRVLEAYRFQLPGARFPRYYNEQGREIEHRLVDGPIAEYEQITSLLKDGRRHQGVDFKAPTGTPVTSPFSGVVQRTNFNYRVNGGSLDIEDGSGRRILFLHLSELAPGIQAGTRIKKGQLVAYSGNTGRSTAPHLHYQVMSKAGRVLDPFEIHRTEQHTIAAEHRAAFDAKRAELMSLFPPDPVSAVR